MTDEPNNVVPMKAKEVPSREGWALREQEALALARLAAMPELDYERARRDAARQLKCRISWLDNKVGIIRRAALPLRDLPPPKDPVEVGHAIRFWRDGHEPITGFVVAGAHEHGKDRHLLVLADGNATAQRSYPMTDEEFVQRYGRETEET